jgi:hypothetical protein
MIKVNGFKKMCVINDMFVIQINILLGVKDT